MVVAVKSAPFWDAVDISIVRKFQHLLIVSLAFLCLLIAFYSKQETTELPDLNEGNSNSSTF